MSFIFGTLSFAVVSRRSCIRLQSAVYDTLKRAKVNVTRADSLSDAVMIIHCELAFIRSFIYYSAPDNRRTGHFRRGGWIDFGRKIWGSARKMKSRTNTIKQDETRKLDYIDCGN